MTSHALITPWPLSKGLMTWCGQTDKEVGKDFIATSPEMVNCVQCRRSMRMALTTLGTWVPGLPYREQDRA